MEELQLRTQIASVSLKDTYMSLYPPFSICKAIKVNFGLIAVKLITAVPSFSYLIPQLAV